MYESVLTGYRTLTAMIPLDGEGNVAIFIFVRWLRYFFVRCKTYFASVRLFLTRVFRRKFLFLYIGPCFYLLSNQRLSLLYSARLVMQSESTTRVEAKRRVFFTAK